MLGGVETMARGEGRVGWSGVGGLQWFMQLWMRPAACAKACGLSLVWGGVA